MTNIRITRRTLESIASRKLASRPCGDSFRFRNRRIDVAWRDWSDHYDIYNSTGHWLCSFTDSSMPGLPRFENIHTAQGVRLILPT